MMVTTSLSSRSGQSMPRHSARFTSVLHQVARQQQRDRGKRTLRKRPGLLDLPADGVRVAGVLERDSERSEHAFRYDAPARVPGIGLAPVPAKRDEHAERNAVQLRE